MANEVCLMLQHDVIMTLYPQVQVRWFYHPAEVEGTAEGGGRVQDLEVTSNALFSSSHEDQNDVQTISHRCSLLELEVSSLRVIIMLLIL